MRAACLVNLDHTWQQGAAPMQGWQPASILNAREGHTATLLHSGRVLVNGGIEMIFLPGDPPPAQWKALRTADLYHPDTNEWIITGSMAIARYYHTATLLPDGTVLVVGGRNETYPPAILETEIYDPSTQAWSFTAHSLRDGKVLVMGGVTGTGFTTSTEIYNPAINPVTPHQWTEVGRLNSPREGPTATLLSDGRVLVVGGFEAAISVELFNPLTLFWTPAEDLRSGSRWGHTATLLSDGKVLVAGGARIDDYENPLISCEIFDPVTGHWADTGA
jgi:Galactose oxidase, central domain